VTSQRAAELPHGDHHDDDREDDERDFDYEQRSHRGATEKDADRFIALATAVFELSTESVDRAWYSTLEAISGVAADIGGVGSTPTADASGHTTAELLGNVRTGSGGGATAGANSIHVLAQGDEFSTPGAQNFGGGLAHVGGAVLHLDPNQIGEGGHRVARFVGEADV